jgi:molybdopterin-containing oxidoreductase family membrane subunit
MVALGFAYTESIWFWVNFNSPLLWDVFAISTYLSVSLVFWTGLLPFAIRDRAITPFNKRVYSILSFWWSGREETFWGSFVSSRRISYASCSFGTYYCIDGFCYLCDTWMAHYYIPPFRCGCCVFRFCDTLIIMRKVSKLEAYITITLNWWIS